ncbi:hypothetical protein RHAB15C_0000083 [Candidatus Rhabdochlamydia porcellionis]|jgi:hypothetical protein|uniref:Uncharacterized protein n=1 Tax=Candidatus Rhabdochlamydia porcellionis TaxID=225148 RepID=A0ABX8YYV6_9BACT|nr:hypothetical protein RHAB15C_0000083 [Candidatus Rhabdochlamydia porcellionis]
MPIILFIKDGQAIDRYAGLISKKDLSNKIIGSRITSEL